MKRLSILLAFLLALGGIARAAGLTGYACNGWGLTVLTGPSICGTAPSPPAGCTGAIDLSTGCAQPMLGGL